MSVEEPGFKLGLWAFVTRDHHLGLYCRPECNLFTHVVIRDTGHVTDNIAVLIYSPFHNQPIFVNGGSKGICKCQLTLKLGC